MKQNKWNLIASVLHMLASICFLAAAAAQMEMLLKCLFGAAGLCQLFCAVGFFCTYVKKQKAEKGV